ncbi:hypothetical protein [Borrelia sp. RT5S]|uniref:structural cement protein Gp24 n=1 Tax=Borrelia sp. RT5S TaxID=2898581 RepID=UPI001E56F2CC|nr:hypothetical protein [Borrelia sp. RT5S]UGQ16718.1 hypothetical protein LSO06_05205 [Borrelia sp. RT5S]
MPDFDFTSIEKRFVIGSDHKSGTNQTETAVVDVNSDIIQAGMPVLATGKSSPMGDILVKAPSSAGNGGCSVRGFALRKVDIKAYENPDYFPGEMIPIRRFGEIVVKLDNAWPDPKIGDLVFLKCDKLVKDGNGGEGVVQVGRVKDTDPRDKNIVLLDINIGPEYDKDGKLKFA